jgi:hypothetical protein
MNGYKDLIGFTKRGHKIGYDQHNEQSIEGSKKAKKSGGKQYGNECN